MMIKWNEKSFGWFERASEYTGYSDKMAALLLERVGERGTLCDLGCGMALADMRLAASIGRITCIDANPAAVEYVNSRAGALGIANLTAVCGDAREAVGEWDTVTALFHGETEDIAQKYLPLASDRLIAVVHAGETGKLGPDGYRVKKCSFAAKLEETLNELGIKFRRTDHSLEYGQPLRGESEAAEFIRTYSMNPPDVTVEEYIKGAAVPSRSAEYPLYIPNEKQFSIFVIRRQENEDFCRRCAPRG